MQIEEILIIKNDNISYGLDTAAIDQIMRVPELTPLALSPSEVRGLCAVGGNITTTLDMNSLLDAQNVNEKDSKSRLLTLAGDFEHVSLLVAEVIDTVDIDKADIEYIDNPEDAVCAIYKHDSDIVQILDLSRLTERVQLRTYHAGNIKDGGSNIATAEEEQQSNTHRFLLFSMATERYAIGIDYLREIIALPEGFTKVAGSSEEVAGIISLREELLLIADLRTYYGYSAERTDKNRIFVARMDNKNIGLIIDEIIDIRDYPQSSIDSMPEHFKDGKLSGVIHDDEQLVSLIGKDVLRELLDANEKHIVTKETNSDDVTSDIAMEVVVFKLDKEEYAINIEHVAEIIDTVPVTPVADAPELISGVINIRGQVVAIGSLHKRLGISDNTTEDQKVIICNFNGNRVGFFVDSVSDVMGIKRDEIRTEEDRGELFSNILQLDGGKRLVLLFQIEKIIF